MGAISPKAIPAFAGMTPWTSSRLRSAAATASPTFPTPTRELC